MANGRDHLLIIAYFMGRLAVLIPGMQMHDPSPGIIDPDGIFNNLIHADRHIRGVDLGRHHAC